MLGNNAIKNMIREGKGHQINSIIQTNTSNGMRLMDDSLRELYRQGKITKESALEHSIDLNYLKTII